MAREYGTPPATTQPYGPPKILHNKERNAGGGFDVYSFVHTYAALSSLYGQTGMATPLQGHGGHDGSVGT